MKPQISIVLFSLLALPLSAGHLTVTKYEFIGVTQSPGPKGTTAETTSTRTLYYAADKRQLSEVSDLVGKARMTEIYTPDGTHSVLDINAKKFYTVTDSQLHSSAQNKGKALGSKTIQGLACHGFSVTQPDGTYSESWWCIDPASGDEFLADFLLRLPIGAEHHQYLNKITKNVQVPENFFDVPSDYQFDNTIAPNIGP